jgi:predicted Zn-dependent peptidase
MEQLRRIGELYFPAKKARLVAVVPEGFSYPRKEAAGGLVRRERRVLEGPPFPMVAQSLPSTRVFSFALAVRGGLAGDQEGQEGLGGLVARAILRGGSGERVESLGDRLDRWGVEARAGTKRDYSFVKFSAPEGEFEDALYGISRAIVNPALDSEALERTRQELLAESLSPRSIAEAAERELWARAFAGTPYAAFPPGKTEALEGLKSRLRAKAAQHREAWWRPPHFAVAVSGPREVDELVRLVRLAFDPIAQYPVSPPLPVDFTLPAVTPQTLVIDRDLSQALLVQGWFAPESTLDALVTFLLLREILVGGPGARLWPLRQEQGLLYHLGGRVVVTRQVLGFHVSMLLPLDSLKAGIEAVRREFDRLRVDEIDTAELDLARRALRQQDAQRRERGLSLVEEEAWFLLAGWTRQDYLYRLEQETPRSFRQKVRRFFRQSAMWTVAAGPRDTLVKQLATE